MNLVVMESYEAMSQRAAEFVADALRGRPDANIVVPTGATPARFYVELAALHRRGAFDASRLRVFQLDEYLGVGPSDPRSFALWLKQVILDPLGIGVKRFVRLPGDAADSVAACAAYDRAVADAGGFDLAVLGLGSNGHLGFNEPPTAADAPTRVVRLSDETIAANARYWAPDVAVPRRALTCGMANLLAARAKLLLVAGTEKREILRRVVSGPVSAQTPASWLRASEQVTIMADVAAWSGRASAALGAREE